MIEWQRLSDVEWIFLILAIIYLGECSCWVRTGAVCFGSGLRWHGVLGTLTPLGNESGRLVITNPLPLATAFLCQPWPMAMDEHGLLSEDRTLRPAPNSGEASDRWIPYEAVCSIEQYDREVCVNGRTIAVLALPENAAFVAARLRRICNTAAEARRQAIEDVLDEVMDAKAVAARVAALNRITRSLRFASGMLLVYTFGVGLPLYYVSAFPWTRITWSFLAGFLALWLMVVVEYYAVRRAVCHEERASRLWHVIMLLLSPASAMRAGEKVLRNLLATCHPLAVAAAVCSPKKFAVIGGRTLRELRHPTPEKRLPEGSAAGRARAWFFGQLCVRAERIVRNAGLDPQTLLSEPLRAIDAHSYCPRCLGQYVTAQGHCGDCGGVPLRPFTDSAVPRSSGGEVA